LPLLRAHAKKHGPLAVVHFDAHPDTWDSEYPGQKYSHGTPFIRAIEEGLIDTAAYLQIGIRGPTVGPQDYADARRLGAHMITLDEFRTRTMADVIAEVRTRIGAKPYYLTLDIDCVDPAFAPGTGTPEVGGLTSYEILQLVRGLRDLPLVGADLVEVAPSFDHVHPGGEPGIRVSVAAGAAETTVVKPKSDRWIPRDERASASLG
jgi:arginase family enzyme